LGSLGTSGISLGALRSSWITFFNPVSTWITLDDGSRLVDGGLEHLERRFEECWKEVGRWLKGN
jgi:hypothetical protein